MKLYLVDEKHILDQKILMRLPEHVEVVNSITEIKDSHGLASLTDEFSAREYFGTTQERPVKFLGERFDHFEFGVTLPKFDHTISDEFSRVKDFFTKALVVVQEYNKTHTYCITGLIYRVDQLVLRQADFIKHFDAFIEAYQSTFKSGSA